MRKQLQVAAIAAAVGAAFSAPAFGAATPIIGAGASAVKNTILNLVLADYCSGQGVTYYDNATAAPTSSTASPGGAIWRVTCGANTAARITNGIDITYDSSGGSWKGLTATTSALFANAQSTLNANPISTITIGTGTTFGVLTPTILGHVFTFTYVWGASAPSVGALSNTSVTFGLTDVEASMFTAGANQPLVNGSWNTGASPIFSSITPSATELAGSGAKFGVVMGIGASPKLYSALQADQIAAGTLPSSCVAGTIGTASNSICAPNISKAQYRSIVSANFGALNTNAAALFTSVVPADTSIELARRDQGSGTQASSNAYFLNIGCASSFTEASDLSPALPVDLGVVPATNAGTNANVFQVSYNATTGGVIGRLAPVAATAAANPGVTSGFAIGVVSAENEGKLNGAGFLRLDGVYPSNTTAAAGLYDYVTEENLHGNPNATGDSLQFIKDLLGTGGAPASETAAGYTGTGIVNLGTSSYNNNATICAGWRHI